MTTVNINGNNYECLEHMKEIKATYNGHLFNKYYNKKQMFKDLLGKVKRYYKYEKPQREEFKFNPEEGFESEYDNFGKMVGQVIYSADYDYTIEIYKVEDLNFKVLDLVRELDWGSFLVKDDNGQVYFVYTNED